MKAAILFPLLVVALLATGCENTDIQDWKNQTRTLRQQAEAQIAHMPYRGDEHSAFKAYFVSLSSMALSLERDGDKRQRFNEAVRSSNVDALCGEIFMEVSRWRHLMVQCMKNRFFLCAEEVRAYPTLHRALRSALRPDQARRFDGAAYCREPQALE